MLCQTHSCVYDATDEMHLNPMGYDYLLSIPSPRAGQAFMKKMCISII